MRHLVLKRLQPAELGWFEVCREAGREAIPQRGLHLEADFVREVLRPSDAGEVPVACHWSDGERAVDDVRPVVRDDRVWRLAGDTVTGDRFKDAEAGDILVMEFRTADVATDPQPLAELTWDILPRTDRRLHGLIEMASRALGGERFAVVEEPTAEYLVRVARRRLRAFGGVETFDAGGLSDADWESAVDWLRERCEAADLTRLLRTGTSPATKEVLTALGGGKRSRVKSTPEETVLRQFGAELLCDRERREVLIRAFKRDGTRPPKAVKRWHKGGVATRKWVQQAGLPDAFAGYPSSAPADYEDVDAFTPLGDLHDYQVQVAKGIKRALRADAWEGRRAVVWMPTGTGKTRVMVETLLEELPLEPPRNCIVWIADREEICEQAVETFRHVWMTKGRSSGAVRSGSVPTLRIVRFWGGREWEEPPTHPTVVIASIQKLALGLEDESFQEELAILGERSAAVVFDEAHHVVAPTYGRVIEALGLGVQKNYLARSRTTGPPLFGLTATPSRSDDDETERLSRRFSGRLIEPSGRYRSLAGFQDGGFMSLLDYVRIKTGYRLELSSNEREQWERFQTLPGSALKRAGEDPQRTAAIVRDLEERLSDLRSVLVFACSVMHAHTIAEVLVRRGHKAAAVDGGTPRPLRWQTIQRFRDREIHVLVNCDLLATGFDAPNVDAVAIARPVESRVLFTQMVGRGLRGPANGGTSYCTLLDYEDRFDAIGNLDAVRDGFRRDFVAAAGVEP